jgi:hypothetical protein
LNRYIIFEAPHTQGWFHTNVGIGVYNIPNEYPNDYRNRNYDLLERYDEDEN